MRKLLVGLVVAVAVLAIVIGLLSFQLSSFLAAHSGRIAETVAEAIGRPVEIDEIGVSWRGGLAASVRGLRIAEDPRFGSGDFLDVERAFVTMRIWPALFGEYEARSVRLDGPRLRLVRDANGFNFDSLGTKPSSDGDNSSGVAPERPATQETLALLIGLARIEDGTLTFVDQTAKPPVEISIDRVRLSATDASLNSKVGLDFRGRALGSDDTDLSITGEIGPIGNALAIDTTPIDLTAEIGPFAIDRLKQHPVLAAYIPADFSSTDGLRGDFAASGNLGSLSGSIVLDATAAGLAYGDFSKPAGTKVVVKLEFERTAEAIRLAPITTTFEDAVVHSSATIVSGKTLSIDATLSTQRLPFAGLVLGGLNAGINLRGDRIDVPRTGFTLNDAPVSVRSTYDTRDSTFSTELETQGVDMKPFLLVRMPELAEQIDGKLDADLQLTGHNASWPLLRDSLRGNGRIDVRQGTLHNVNLVEMVLAGATGVQGLTQLVSASTRRKYPGLLESADTVFEVLHASVQIADGVASTKDLLIRAPDYEITGRGDMQLDNRIDVHAVLRASERLTDDIVDTVKIAKHLRNADRRLEIPFRLKGSWPKVRPKVDEDALLASLGRGALGKGLADLLGGGDKERSDAGSSETPPKAKDLLRQGLQELFGR